jgi:hypothetical protein
MNPPHGLHHHTSAHRLHLVQADDMLFVIGLENEKLNSASFRVDRNRDNPRLMNYR